MPVLSGFDGSCLLAIFTDARAGFHIAGDDGERFVLEKDGVAAAIILRPSERYSQAEVEDWLDLSKIGWELFYQLKADHCP